jgi:4-diphosphocytidyl-2-C-methyl-D-erythritol kinase
VNKLVLNSHAKLNLYLEVLNKRKDSYHNIKTLFERIDLSDTIILTVRRDKLIKIICSNPLVPEDNSNLCYRSARLLQESFNETCGLDIEIIKRIPVGAGLGGGSSNAASVLLGLNKLWGLKLKRQELCSFARKLGADVAFFLYDTAFAIGEGLGDEIKPLKLQRVKPLWHILVVPKIVVRTEFVYRKWDELKNFGLTKPRYDVNILTLALRKRDTSLICEILFNSLEQVSMKLYPEIKRIKQKLAKLGLRSILMSGSGPAVFGIVSSRKEAVSLSRQLEKQESSWRIFVTRTA